MGANYKALDAGVCQSIVNISPSVCNKRSRTGYEIKVGVFQCPVTFSNGVTEPEPPVAISRLPPEFQWRKQLLISSSLEVIIGRSKKYV